MVGRVGGAVPDAIYRDYLNAHPLVQAKGIEPLSRAYGAKGRNCTYNYFSLTKALVLSVELNPHIQVIVPANASYLPEAGA